MPRSSASANLWLISDEAYEDVVFDGAGHVSPASLPGMYERTISIYTFSKSYAMTGLRLGYLATPDAALRERIKKVLFYTCSNVTSIVQFGGIGALEGSQDSVAQFRDELQARRNLFYDGIRTHAGGLLTGAPPRGAFYAFLRIDPAWPHEPARRCRGRWPSSSSRAPASAACPARTSARTARATSGSASPGIGVSCRARWSRWAGCSVSGRVSGPAAAS